MKCTVLPNRFNIDDLIVSVGHYPKDYSQKSQKIKKYPNANLPNYWAEFKNMPRVI